MINSKPKNKEQQSIKKAYQVLSDKEVYDNEEKQLTVRQKPQLWNHIINVCDYKNLKKLRLYYNNISSINMNPLVENKNWEKLMILDIIHNSIGTKGIKLLKRVNFKSLRQLTLNQCRINSEGMKELSKFNLPNLTKFDVSVNKIGLDGYSWGASNNWKSLDLFEVVISILDTIASMEMFVKKSRSYKINFTIENNTLKKLLQELQKTR